MESDISFGNSHSATTDVLDILYDRFVFDDSFARFPYRLLGNEKTKKNPEKGRFDTANKYYYP